MAARVDRQDSWNDEGAQYERNCDLVVFAIFKLFGQEVKSEDILLAHSQTAEEV